MSVWPDDLFEPGRRESVWLHAEDGWRHRIDAARWHEVTAGDLSVLERAVPAVLDVGCGPGRLTAALAAAGVMAMGVDTSPAAVAATRRRGGPAWLGSVFADVPHAGGWSSVLLLDGNIGIGGCPVSLLARCRQLVRPGGQVLVELEPPGAPSRRGRVRVAPSADPGHRWFDWAMVPATEIGDHASVAGLHVVDSWEVDGRWFAEMVAP